MNRLRILPFALLLATMTACSSDDGTSPPLVGRPKNVQLSFNGGNTEVLSWEPGANATAYIIQRAIPSATPPVDFTTIATVVASPYIDTNLAPGTYSYRIASTDGRSTTGYASAGTIGFD